MHWEQEHCHYSTDADMQFYTSDSVDKRVDVMLKNILGKLRKKENQSLCPQQAMETQSTSWVIRENTLVSCDKNVEHVEIPYGVRVIGERAFAGCHNLRVVMLPSSLRKISAKGFYDCKALEKVELPSGLCELGEEAFAFTALTGITIPGHVDTVGEKCFLSNRNLSEVTLLPGVKTIGKHAFENCSNLTKLVLPQSLKEIEEGAFSSCTALAQLSLPNGLKQVGEVAFSWCEGLTEVLVPDSVDTIGKRAFGSCKNLIKLEGRSVHGPKFRIEQGILKEIITLRDEPILRVPEGVTEIAPHVFGNGTVHVLLPDSLRVIGKNAFDRCLKLMSVEIPEGVSEIGERAFSGCGHLAQISLPKSLKKLGRNAFSDCKALEQIYLGDSITELEYGTFYRCYSLREVFIPDSVQLIDAYVFKECSHLESVRLPATLRSIGYCAFEKCSCLKEINLPDTVEELDFSAFEFCAALEAVHFSSALHTMGKSCFSACISLVEAILPDTVSVLPYGAFSGCAALTRVRLPVSASIDRYAFAGCASLEVVEHPNPTRFEDALYETPYWMGQYPSTAEKVRLPADLIGNHMGAQLRNRGYTFFEEDRSYYIDRPGNDGIVEVSSWCGDDGPDEDGYGREEYYDWWLLDEGLNPIPGIKWRHSYSRQDMRNHEEEWARLREKAAAAVRKRQS